jgi:hypothetical protein
MDAALAFDIVPQTANPLGLLDSTIRVLRPGGTLAVGYDPAAPAAPPLSRLVEWLVQAGARIHAAESEERELFALVECP